MNPTYLPTQVCFPFPLSLSHLSAFEPRNPQLTQTSKPQGPTNALIPPTRTTLPLWLALLLKRQRRVNIIPPPWLDIDSLREILELETTHYQDEFSPAPPLPELDTTTSTNTYNHISSKRSRGQPNDSTQVTDINGRIIPLSPPFLPSNTATPLSTTHQPAPSLPYHWYELSQHLLTSCPDDLAHPDTISNLIRDIREVRQAKLRRGYAAITDGSEGVRFDGVGAMEVSESRGFVMGVMRGLAGVSGGREGRDEEGVAGGGGRGTGDAGSEEDEDMEE